VNDEHSKNQIYSGFVGYFFLSKFFSQCGCKAVFGQLAEQLADDKSR